MIAIAGRIVLDSTDAQGDIANQTSSAPLGNAITNIAKYLTSLMLPARKTLTLSAEDAKI